VGVVGADFDHSKLDFLRERGVDLAGLEVRSDGKTFRWGGIYGDDLNSRETTFTHLNVFEDFQPKIPPDYRNSEYVFLANIGPDLQLDVLNQITSPKLVALDTMNFWIEGNLEQLKQTLTRVDVLVINDSEARQLAGNSNLVLAAAAIQKMGPQILIIKKGENGALLFAGERIFAAPAYPLSGLNDPTGAGDTFAGGFMGYLARCGDTSFESLKQAIIFGSTLASFCVEEFSVDRLVKLNREVILARYETFWQMTSFNQRSGM
jgi:sugar/nucleoside kinase (ribokinase family)